MAMEGFTLIKATEREFNELVNQKCASMRGEIASPFQEGAVFTLDTTPIAVMRRDDGAVHMVILLKAKDSGNTVELWLSMLLKTGIQNNQLIISDAEINKKFVESVAGKELTNKEFAEAFTSLVGTKEFAVVRTRYTRTINGVRGRFDVPASLVGFKFVD